MSRITASTATVFVALIAVLASSLALATPPQGTGSSEVSHTAGLEEWFDYESIETGAGARAHVNLATGNLVWHATPLVNAGRGLSTFLNLTYPAGQGRPGPGQRRGQ